MEIDKKAMDLLKTLLSDGHSAHRIWKELIAAGHKITRDSVRDIVADMRKELSAAQETKSADLEHQVRKLRKEGYGYRVIYNRLKPDFPGLSQGFILNKCSELDDEQDVRTAHLRANVKKKIEKQERKRSTLIETIAEDILGVCEAIPAPTIKPWRHTPGAASRRAEELMMLISDVHCGSRVMPDETEGLSIYNFDIFKMQVAELHRALESILPRHIHDTPCPRLHFGFLGDMVDGKNVYRGQREHVDLAVAYQVYQAVDKFAELIATLAEYQPWDIYLWCVPGNHGRIGEKGDNFGPADNFDFVVYMWLRDRLREFKNVHVVFQQRWTMLVEIQKHTFHLSHGHEIQGWAGIPYYGFDRAHARYQQMYAAEDTYIDYFLSAHHHAMETTDSRIMNGAWPGGSPLSVGKMQKNGRPIQMLFAVHEENGVVWQRPLHLRPKGMTDIKVWTPATADQISA